MTIDFILSESPMSTSKCYNYEWRTHLVHKDWKAWCRLWGKHWTFQLEKGELTDRAHFQGIISLKTKRTKAECLSVMGHENLPEHFQPICNANLKAGSESFYVTKPDTRIDGPWTDKDVEKFVPRQYRGLEERLYPWQQYIWDNVDNFEPRFINLILDHTGCSGKSTLASLMELHDKGIDMPPVNDADKLIQSLADILIAKQERTPKCIFFDIPRAMKQDKLYGLYAALEQIKKGKVTDLRYSYKQWWFDSPQIWVFCNTVPDVTMLSMDRWKFWEISPERNLVGAALEVRSVPFL